jgi:hypothetical protein
MGDGYSRRPKLLKGAIVQFIEMPIVPLPNIIIFQYNPETLSRSLAPWDRTSKAGEHTAMVADDDKEHTFVEPFHPDETFSVSLLIDATDALETEEPVAMVTGVADRMAALEMLLYPQTDGLGGGLTMDVTVSLGGPGADAQLDASAETIEKLKQAKKPKVPVVLFIWGPGRIVPVRLTKIDIEEQAWNQLLYPTRAKVTVGMKVITSEALAWDVIEGGSEKNGVDIAKACYEFTIAQKQVLALANLLHVKDAILDLLPT